jgi:hypothetical protein
LWNTRTQTIQSSRSPHDASRKLSTRRRAVTEAINALKVARPAGHHPDEILAMLDAVPDLRPSLRNATEQELADLLAAFDVTISYDKPNRRLTLTATIGQASCLHPKTTTTARRGGR